VLEDNQGKRKILQPLLLIQEKQLPEQLREYLAEVLPNFDRERVYVADIKKLVSWY